MPDPKPKTKTIMLARMAYEGKESSRLVDWLVRQSVYCHSHPLVEEVYHCAVTRTAPVARARNLAAVTAQRHGADILIMVDADIVPPQDFIPQVLKVFEEAEKRGDGAGIVVAPAICDNGDTNIFAWTQPNCGNFQYVGPLTLGRIGALEASYYTGLGEAAACGTGCIAIDTRLFAKMDYPWFAVEYGDEMETDISTGEDIYFTRTATEQSARIHVLWDHWCEHIKEATLRKPVPIPPDAIPRKYREILEQARLQ